jgi:hypothetical protein
MVARRTANVHQRIKELEESLHEFFPELETESWCDSPNQCVIQAYTNAENEYDVFDVLGDKIGEILDEDGVLIAVVPLPLAGRYEDDVEDV